MIMDYFAVSTTLLLLQLISVYVLQAASPQTGCNEDGWFGKDCRYMCHCHGESTCNSRNGYCDPDICADEWFGPACQYKKLKLLTHETREPVPYWMSDNDDSTCRNNTSKSELVVDLERPQPLTWMRIAVSVEVNLRGFSVQYSTSTNKHMQGYRCRFYRRKDSKSVDMGCEIKKNVKILAIQGDQLAFLCSLHVSGGRNVVLKKVVLSQDETTGYALAVDGKLGGQYSPCTVSDRDSRSAWRLTLEVPVDVVSMFVYGSRASDETKGTLANFTVKVYNGEGTVYVYNKTGAETQETYVIVPPQRIGSEVNGFEIFMAEARAGVEICEVEVFGESSCKEGSFGLDCQEFCQCHDHAEWCLPSTGGCVTGCTSGYWGDDCSETCPYGLYGRGCIENCSENCVGGPTACRVTDGTCLNGCLGDFEPPLCVIVGFSLLDLKSPEAIGGIVAVCVIAMMLFAVVVCRGDKNSDLDSPEAKRRNATLGRQRHSVNFNERDDDEDDDDDALEQRSDGDDDEDDDDDHNDDDDDSSSVPP